MSAMPDWRRFELHLLALVLAVGLAVLWIGAVALAIVVGLFVVAACFPVYFGLKEPPPPHG